MRRRKKQRFCSVFAEDSRLNKWTLEEIKSPVMLKEQPWLLGTNSSFLSSAYAMRRSVNTLLLLSTHVTAFSLDPRQ